MFSQLCRARPRTLWNKFTVRQSVAETQDSQSHPEIDGEDNRCQLQHCTFCDYRVCCQVTSYEWESENLPVDFDIKVTENPAYGLSSKNWLEFKENENEVDTMPQILSETVESFSSEKEQIGNCEIHQKCLEGSCQQNTDCPSQKEQDCDANTIPKKMSQLNIPAQSCITQNKTESKSSHAGDSNEVSKLETFNLSDQKHSALSWSMLRHRQLSGDALKNCDNKPKSCVIEHSCDIIHHDSQPENEEKIIEMNFKQKRNIKDRSFPLSLMRPIAKIGDRTTDILPQQLFGHKNDLSRQRPVQKIARDKFQNAVMSKETDKAKKLTNDILGSGNPLSEISQIKTEESIQEWLARIGESGNNAWPEDSEAGKDIKVGHRAPWRLTNNTDEEKGSDNVKYNQHSFGHANDDLLLDDDTHHSSELPRKPAGFSHKEQKQKFEEPRPKREDADTSSLLCNASKASPANVPMVVMQCSRLHSHIGCKPPFQQTSLPMGTLVTALYQESDWLYVQTPHGVEGYVTASNCVPIGTTNDPAHTSRRPWEPCDFPIQISMRKKCEFGRQQGSYVPAKLPTNNGKQAPPYVSTVKMKTNFYSDRCFSHTFKSKDSIKTAKTVTDILRSSPETKISNQ